MISRNEMEQIARIFFPKAFQLVLGCGAEPTINKNFMFLLELAKKHKVPNISIVTNGQLLRSSDLEKFVELGIDEILMKPIPPEDLLTITKKALTKD